MLGPLVKSILKETVEKLPEEFAMKSDSVPNYLIKQGVKPEELKFAELGLPKGTVTKADLKKAEELRGGTLGRVPSVEKSYSDVTLRGEEHNPTYTEQVYLYNPSEPATKRLAGELRQTVDKYKPVNVALEAGDTAKAEKLAKEAGWDGEEDLRAWSSKQANEAARIDTELGELPEGYTSRHFERQPDYLMHARTIDQDINGTPTRTILELQSDLHQKGKRQGYLEFGERRISKEEYAQINDAIISGDVMVNRILKDFNPNHAVEIF